MLEYIRQHPILKHTRLVAYGQSLGGAAAIHLVSQNEDKFSALIIENTFLSVVSCIPFSISFIRICLFIYLYFDQPLLVPHIFPALRHLVYLVHQTWKSYKTIQYVKHVPILFLSSLKDELVPPGHMAKLYKIAQTSGTKVWRDFENGTHNDTCMQVMK